MDRYEREQSDRDDGLLRKMCYAQETLAVNVRNWMQRELRELIWRTQMLEVMTITPDAKSRLRLHKESIARIYDNGMEDAFNRLEERRDEIEGGLYDDPLQSQQNLNDSSHIILDIMRSLLGIRLDVDELWKECQPDAED